jgi:hypothetical protein
MTIGLLAALRNNRLQLILDAMDSSSDEYEGAHLLIYSGDRPDTGEDIDEYDNFLLADFVLPFPSGSITDGVLTFGIVNNTVGLANGIASWARITDAIDNFVMDLSVTATGGSGDIKISSTSIEIDGTVKFISGIITEGNV